MCVCGRDFRTECDQLDLVASLSFFLLLHTGAERGAEGRGAVPCRSGLGLLCGRTLYVAVKRGPLPSATPTKEKYWLLGILDDVCNWINVVSDGFIPD